MGTSYKRKNSILFILALTVLQLGCASTPAVNVRELYTEDNETKPLIKLLKNKWNHRVSKATDTQLKSKPLSHNLATDQKKVQRIMDHLVSRSPNQNLYVPVTLVNECDTYDAGTTEIKTVDICSGVLSKANTEDEIAFVLGHELGHIILQHKGKKFYLRKFQTKKNIWLYFGGFSLLLISPETALISLAGLAMYDKWGAHYDKHKSIPKYLRYEEDEADLLSIDLLVAAGYNPNYAIQAIDQVTYINKKRKFNKEPSPPENMAKEMRKTISPWFIIDQYVYKSIRESSDTRDHEDGKKRADLIIYYIERFYKHTSNRPYKSM